MQAEGSKTCSCCGRVREAIAFRKGKRACRECVAADVKAKRTAGHYRVNHELEAARKKRAYSLRKDRGYRATWEQRIPERVARAARNGREYWPEGCRVEIPEQPIVKPRPEPKPWHGIKDVAERSRVKYQHCERYRLYHRMKRWMRKHLRSGKSSKVWSPVVGYTVDELKTHLERQFSKGMGWHNMGEWHIDHIVPVSAFQFDSPSDPSFRAAMALSNLRPLWASDNLTKSDARTHLL
jgi:hypothetical protein